MKIREHINLLPWKATEENQLNDIAHAISIAATMDACLWVEDKNRKIIYVNPIYENTLGYSLRESIGLPGDFCFDENSKKTMEKHHKLREKNLASKYEAKCISKSGEVIPFLIIGGPTGQGGSYGISVNLKGTKRREEEAILSQEIIKHSSEAVVVLNEKYQIKLWNSGAEKMFGYREEEVLNKNIYPLILPPNKKAERRKLEAEIAQKSFIKNFETQRMAKDKTLIDVSLSTTQVSDKKKKFIGYLLIYRDITNQKHSNKQLQQRFESIQEAYKELGIQKRHLDYFCEISRSATSKDTLEKLEKLIVSAICMLTKCDGVILRLYCEKSKSLVLKSCLGVSENWWTKSKIPFKNSIAEEAFLKKRAIIIDGVSSNPKHRSVALLKKHDFKTLILLPLFLNNNFIGSISLYASDTEKLRFLETDFLENFAKQCSLSIYAKQNSSPKKSQ